MDLNYLLIWITGFINLLTLIRSLGTEHQRRWVWASAVVLLALGGSLALAPDVAGWVGAAAWALLVLVPARALRAVSVALARQEYGKALRLSRRLKWLVPFNRWDQQTGFFQALELAQKGCFSEAEAAFEKLQENDARLERAAGLQLLRLQNKWDEVLDILTHDLRTSRLSRDPYTIVLLLRALGETGQPNELLSAYEHFRPLVESRRLPEPLRKSCHLFVLAFCGKKEPVEQIVQETLHYYPEYTKDLWRATADMAGGRADEARARLEELQAESNALDRKMIERRLLHPLPVANAVLTEASRSTLAGLERKLDEEARYEIRTKRAFRTAHATKILIAANLLVFVVEGFAGGSENVETLLRLGALDPEAVKAGEWWRLLMASFLHMGPLHLASNMLGLYILGPYVELSLGTTRFAVLYFVATIGSMAYCFIDMAIENADAMLVGASGAIMALVGAVGALLMRGWQSERSRLALRKLNLILVIIVAQLTFDTFTPQISIKAHVSGLVIGFLVAILMRRRPDGDAKSARETKSPVTNAAGLAFWGLVAAALSLGACAHQAAETSARPYGQVILETARPEKNFDSFLVRAARESEMFRRRFISEEGPSVMAATLRFQKTAVSRLQGRPRIDGFQLDAGRLLDQVKGAGNGRLSGETVFGAFTGKWYGLWTDFEVDHHWGEVVELETPRQVEIPGSDVPVWVRSYQYAWVGDGYGLNLVASGPDSPQGDYILGYVIHVEGQDLSRERMSRPHVGVFTGAGQLIWITSGEVFLEASTRTAAGDAAYSITGFRYRVEAEEVRYGECFQAVYTRNPDRRPAFFSFSM